MPFSPFYEKCLETAVRETRSITFPKPENGVPAGKFVLHELYCDDQDCDCRRVILRIHEAADEQMVRPLACVNYGWEPPSFYQSWMGGPHDGMVEQLSGVTLELFVNQGPAAPAFRDLVEWMIRTDAKLEARFRDHYREFKEVVAAEANRGVKGGRKAWMRRRSCGG